MVPCTAAESLTEAEFETALVEAVARAQQKGIGSIVTNGAADRYADMESKNARAERLIAYAINPEKFQGIAVELIGFSETHVALANTKYARQ